MDQEDRDFQSVSEMASGWGDYDDDDDHVRSKRGKHGAVSLYSLTMADVEESLAQRGLNFLKKEEEVGYPEKIDIKQEGVMEQVVFEECAEKGFHWNACSIFPQLRNIEQAKRRLLETAEQKHARQIFIFPIRYTSLIDAKLVNVNFAKMTIEYISDERIIKSRKMKGSKVAQDLVGSDGLLLWYRGDISSVRHSLYSEEYRDYMISVLKMRDKAPFTFICIQKGNLLKKGRSGFTHNPRYCRIVAGMFVIYRNSNSEYPLDSFCLVGVEIEKNGKNFTANGKERVYSFKCSSEKECRIWIQAIEMAKFRCHRERDLIKRHIFWRKYERKMKKSISQRKLIEKRELEAKKPYSKETLQRGFRLSELVPSNDDDDLEDASSVTEDSQLVKENLKKLHSRSQTLPKLNISEEKFSFQKVEKSPSESGQSVIEENFKVFNIADQKKTPESFYDGGSSEFEIRMVGFDSKEVPVGFIEIESNASLSDFRKQIIYELDYIPKEFIFLRHGIPIGKRQEERRMIHHVVHNNVVVLRVAKVTALGMGLNGDLQSSTPGYTPDVFGNPYQSEKKSPFHNYGPKMSFDESNPLKEIEEMENDSDDLSANENPDYFDESDENLSAPEYEQKPSPERVVKKISTEKKMKNKRVTSRKSEKVYKTPKKTAGKNINEKTSTRRRAKSAAPEKETKPKPSRMKSFRKVRGKALALAGLKSGIKRGIKNALKNKKEKN